MRTFVLPVLLFVSISCLLSTAYGTTDTVQSDPWKRTPVFPQLSAVIHPDAALSYDLNDFHTREADQATTAEAQTSKRTIYLPTQPQFTCQAADECHSAFSPATAANGANIFLTGNKILATSTSSGSSWNFGNPASNFPEFFGNQDIVYIPAPIDRFVWLRQGNFDGTNGNKFVLTVAFANTVCNALRLTLSQANLEKSLSHSYTLTAGAIRSDCAGLQFQNARLDFTNAHLHVSGSLRNGTSFAGSMIFRIFLQNLAAAAQISVPSNRYTYGPFVSTSGIGLTEMHYAAAVGDVYANSAFIFLKWTDAVTTIQTGSLNTKHYYPMTNGTCPGPTTDMCGSLTSGIIAGWKSGSNVGFMFPQAGSGFPPRPNYYIRVLILDAATWTVVDESQDIYSTSEHIAFAGAAPNSNGDVGIAFYATNSTQDPVFKVGILGSTSDKPQAVISSTQGTSSGLWGAYTRVRTYYPTQTQWITAGYALTSACSTDPTDCGVTAKAVVWSNVAVPVAPVAPPSTPTPDTPEPTTPASGSPLTVLVPVPQAPSSPPQYPPGYFSSPEFASSVESPQTYVINTIVPSIGIAVCVGLMILFILCCVVRKKKKDNMPPVGFHQNSQP